ncbi:capsular polysaccharide synthesis protein [Secundilactobacillus pentosiphilus]|uniref:Capsular polysaccharide synthesis protein n=1 Tax=Secundilactobacillus pentosiphilus TaxID=1714682 RepID=A0A1Z5ITR5_9LACO|nr:capsular polysaccharide synthesis protein [Secundilactobacillus pentosiphilus]GAX05140.1 capsular polysaccharide synthesis protein [Secundilactobacillus pentosiphilus]
MKKIFKIVKKFYNDAKNFSLELAILHFKETLSRYTWYTMPPKAYLRKDEIVLEFLKRNYGEVQVDDSISIQTSSPNIWVFWYQGEKQMPDLVRATYSSVKKHSNGHKVILITKDNIETYTHFPELLKNKVKEGSISIAQYSDIIRATLLSTYGGLWLDATVFVKKDIPEDIFRKNIFTIKNNPNKEDALFYISVAHLRWTTYVLGGVANHPLFNYMKTVLIEYNCREKSLIDYLLVDYTIELAMEKSSKIKKDIDNIPISNTNKEELVNCLFAKFPDKKTKSILESNTIFFKLSYKINVNVKKWENTNYDLLINHKILEKYEVED